MSIAAEADAVRADAKARVDELRAVALRLWRDRDDSLVMSELTTVLGQLHAAEREVSR